MASITTRIAKGTPLTWAEVDANFTNLNAAKIETSVISTDGTLSANSDALIPSQRAVKTYVAAAGSGSSGLVVVGTTGQISATTVPTGTDILRTLGYATIGVGGGLYVDDALSDAALAAAHPRACFVTANGRYFRLLDVNGVLTPEQTGAVGDGATNDQPAIQALATYANAVKIEQINFTARQYNLWAPMTRVVPLDEKYDTQGEILVFTRDIMLFSAGGTILKFLGRTGNRLEVDWYLVKATAADPAPNNVFRPCAVVLIGDHNPYPTPVTFRRFSMDGITIEGSCDRTAAEGQILYAGVNTGTGDGWGTDKGIRIQDVVLDQVSLRNGAIRGFKGELFYVGGYGPDLIELNNFHLHTTNGDAFNPGGIGRVLVNGCDFGNSYQVVEALGGKGHAYVNCRFYKSNRAAFLGARVDIGLSGNYAYPNRDETQAAGWTDFANCRFENIVSPINLGSYMRGDVELIDSQIVIGNNSAGARDIFLRVTHWCDLIDGMDAVTINGPATLTTQIAGMAAGTYIAPPSNMHFDIIQRRTKLAADAGRNPGKAFGWAALGYVDASVSVTVDSFRADNPPQADAANPLSFPLIKIEQLDLNVWAGRDFGALWYGANINADTTLQLRSPATLIGSGATPGSTIVLTLPTAPAGGATYGFSEGQEIVLVTSTTGVNFVIDDASAAVLLRAPTRTLKTNHDWIKLRWSKDRNAWQEVDFYVAGAPAPGTVTSVAMTMPTGFTVTGSPITTTGTLAVTTTLNGYIKGNGTGFTASATVATADLSGTLAAAQFPALTGDVTTAAGFLATTIAADAVTNAKLANMATATFKGRVTAATGDPEDLTGTQATTLLDVATGALKGLLSAADKTKLDGVATGATANSSDAFLLARANHTGTQTAATISDFNAASRAQTEAELLAGTNVTITPGGAGATRTLTIAAAGSVTSVSVVTANGVSGSVATATTTPAITLTLGAITPSSVATGTISGTTGTFTGLVLTPASIAGGAGLRLPHGAAPTTPADGDMWTTTAGIFVRVNGATQGPLAAGGSGTVTSVSVTTANGVSGTVATATTTPAITLTLGAITPSSIVASGTISGSNLSGTNTGDQTITLTGNVTGSGTGSFVTTIAANAVTLANMAQVLTATFLGRVTAATGNVEALTATQATSLLNTFPSALKGLVPASGGGTTTFLRADGTFAVPAGGGSGGVSTGLAVAFDYAAVTA